MRSLDRENGTKQTGYAEKLADNLALCGHADIYAHDILDALASCDLHLEPGGRLAAVGWSLGAGFGPANEREFPAGDWVYFIRAEGTRTVKIGYTGGDPYARLKDLQCGCPYPLILLGVIPGDKNEEKSVQSVYSHLHIRGDWFRLEADLADFLETWA